jgi:hypothetical protein
MENFNLIENKIAFQFVEEVSNQGFTGKSEGGIIVQRSDENQVNQPRWAKAIKCADAVTEVQEGDYILIEPLGWTNQLTVDEIDEDRFWVTTEDRVMAVSDEEPKIL